MAARANDLHLNAGARSWLLATPEERDAVARIWASHYVSVYTDISPFADDPETLELRNTIATRARTCADRAITETSSLSVLDSRLIHVGFDCVDQIAQQNGAQRRPQ